jgi:hypothetical protein
MSDDKINKIILKKIKENLEDKKLIIEKRKEVPVIKKPFPNQETSENQGDSNVSIITPQPFIPIMLNKINSMTTDKTENTVE